MTDVGSPLPAADESQAAEDAAPDAEVSFVTRDLAQVLPRAKIATAIPIDDVVIRVRDASNWKGGGNTTGGVRYASASTPSDMRLAYAAEGQPDPYAGFEARVVPENVTLLGKTKDQATGGHPTNERVHVVKKGESIATILRDAGATPDEIKAIAAQLGARGRGRRTEGRPEGAHPDDAAGAGPQAAGRACRHRERERCRGGGRPLRSRQVCQRRRRSLNTPTTTAEVASDDDDDDDGTGVRLYQSIYETALRNKVPAIVIEDMIRVYSYDVDFQRRVQAGDSFEVFFAGDDETPSPDAKNEVLFASLTVGGETKKYYRFQTPDDAIVDYYDETGKSAKKFLVRKPVNNAIMRSGFGSRRHPILGYSRMHTGVDWATGYGTPIFASGNGTIDRDRLGRRLRQVHQHQARRTATRPRTATCPPSPRASHRQARAAGPGDRLCRLHRPLHRRRTCTTRSRSTAASSIRCACACRAAARSRDSCSRAFEQERDRLETQMSNRSGALALRRGRPAMRRSPAASASGSAPAGSPADSYRRTSTSARWPAAIENCFSTFLPSAYSTMAM